MDRIHGSLVGAKYPALGQRGDPVHGRQQFTRILSPSPSGPLAPAVVNIPLVFNAQVTVPAVGDDGCTGLDAFLHEMEQGGRRGIFNGCHTAASPALGFQDLNRDGRKHLLPMGPPPGKSRLCSANIGLVHFYLSVQTLPVGADQHGSESMENCPDRLI